MTKPLTLEEKQQRLLERLQLDNTNLRSLNRKLIRRGGFAFEEVLDELKSLLKKEKPLKVAVEKPSISSTKYNTVTGPNHKEIVGLILSDWHTSEVVKKEDTNGINCYNSLVLANRINKLVESVKKIIKIHQSAYKLEKIWIPMLGDFLNGSIHPELALTNDLTDPAASILCARLLQMLIIDLKSLGLPIELDCVVGNHSRLLLKMPTKAQTQFSYDWIIYEMVADCFSNDKQVTVRINNGQIAIVDQFGWRYVLEHGMDVKNSHEEEFEDKIRAIFDDPTYRKATGLQGSAFDQILIGNLHKPKILERTIVNGCLTGQNELGMSWRLKPVKAQQIMFGISRKHVRTWTYNIDTTDIKTEAPENKYSQYAKGFLEQHGK